MPKTDPPSANAIHGFNHVCFHVADLDAAYDRVIANGAIAVWDPRESPEPGMRMAYVTDPGRQPHRAGRFRGGRADDALVQRAAAAPRRRDGFPDAAVSRIFNRRRPSTRPAAVLRAADVADVAAGVRLAAAEGLRVAVRAGGHSWAAWSLRDDTLLIDLAAFTRMSYDDDTGIVTAGPAIRGGIDLDPFLAARGRFFAGGHCPTVGLGGFLLQGGMGWNCRGWGWAAESIDAIQVVTADGEVAVVRRVAQRRPVLGRPGLRTRLLRRGHRVPAADQAEVPGADPDHLRVPGRGGPGGARLAARGPARRAVVRRAGGGRDHPAAAGRDRPHRAGPGGGRGQLRWRTRVAAGARHLPGGRPALVSKIAQPVTIGELRAEQVRANPEGHRYTVDNAYLAGETSALIPALVPAFTELPTAKSFSLWFDLAHLPARPLPDMALSVQSDLYFATYVVGEEPAQDDLCRSWTDDTMRRLEPFSGGCYLGDSDLTIRPDRFMSDAAWDRFRRVRAARDPARLFAGYDCADESALNRAESALNRADIQTPSDRALGALPAMSITYLKEAVPTAQVAKPGRRQGDRDRRHRRHPRTRRRGSARVLGQVRQLVARELPALGRQIEDIIATLPTQVIDDIQFVQAQVRGFAQAQLESMREIEVETLPGVFLGHRHLPISWPAHTSPAAATRSPPPPT